MTGFTAPQPDGPLLGGVGVTGGGACPHMVKAKLAALPLSLFLSGSHVASFNIGTPRQATSPLDTDDEGEGFVEAEVEVDWKPNQELGLRGLMGLAANGLQAPARTSFRLRVAPVFDIGTPPPEELEEPEAEVDGDVDSELEEPEGEAEREELQPCAWRHVNEEGRGVDAEDRRRPRAQGAQPLTGAAGAAAVVEERRVAGDGSAWTRREFLEYFGEEDGAHHWPHAPLAAPGTSSGTLATVAPPAERGTTDVRRRLCDLLWSSRPCWLAKDLVVAERKLFKAGITSVEVLSQALESGALELRLQRVGVQPFRESTVQELAQHCRSRGVPGGGRGCGQGQATGPADGCSSHGAAAPAIPADGTQGEAADLAAVGRLDAGRTARERSLCDLLWEARPKWTPQELHRAVKKLAQVGIEDIAALDAVLLQGQLNQRLREAQLKAFGSDAIRALRRRLDEVHGRADKQEAWLRSGDGPASLRDVLWECRPTWSASEALAAERKLASIGVKCVDDLAIAVRNGLNERLKEAGLRTFSPKTLGELRQRLRALTGPRPSVGAPMETTAAVVAADAAGAAAAVVAPSGRLGQGALQGPGPRPWTRSISADGDPGCLEPGPLLQVAAPAGAARPGRSESCGARLLARRCLVNGGPVGIGVWGKAARGPCSWLGPAAAVV